MRITILYHMSVDIARKQVQVQFGYKKAPTQLHRGMNGNYRVMVATALPAFWLVAVRVMVSPALALTYHCTF